MPPEEKSSLGKLEEKLYSPNQPTSSFPTNIPASQPHTDTTSDHWTPPTPKPPHKKISIAVWFLIGASVFFLIVMGIAAFFLFTGVRIVSNDKIDITFSQGPTAIASGTAVPLTVTVKNRNPATIINTNVTVDFPEGTRSAADVTQPLVRYTDTLGSIPTGQEKNRVVQAVLFGSVNQTVTIPVTFQYRTANSNQVFTKQEKYTFKITSSPLTITTKAVGTVASGQPFTVQVTVRSNANQALDNIAISARYPAGFTPQVSGSATSTGPIFVLGTIKPGEEKTISITGSLIGTDSDQRTFEFTVGTLKDDGTRSLAVGYASIAAGVQVTKPFLSASLALNNDSSDPLVVSAGQAISGLVSWENTLSNPINNGEVTVRLSGNAFNPGSVTASNGYYDSAHSSIVFSQDTVPALAHLSAGDKGNGSFGIGLKTGAAFSALRAPTIQVSVGVAGKPEGSSAKQSIATSFTRTIRVATNLLLTAKVLHTSGPIQNSGAWPPLQNTPTTYTVVFSATNDVNDVAGATVTTILPSYVTYTGQTSVSTGTITYDDASRTVTWKIGDIPTGTLSKPVQGAFQVSFLPNNLQAGQSPILIQNQRITGTDRFVSSPGQPHVVEYTNQALSIGMVSDPDFQTQFGTVAK